MVDLAALAAEDGLVSDGIAAGDALGRSVATACDLNGDGNADLLVSAYLSDAGVGTGPARLPNGTLSPPHRHQTAPA